MCDNSYLDEIVLTSPESQCLTFNHGLIGKVLFFYKYVEYVHDIHFKEYAESLLDILFENINRNIPIFFMDGLSGIGWCIQYIISSKYEDGDPGEILEDLDNAIMEHDPMRIKDLSFEKGLAGVVAYVRARLDTQDSCVPFDENYLIRLQEACEKCRLDFYGMDYEIDNIYKKILQCYLSIPEKERMPWETGLLRLEHMIREDYSLSEIPREQMDYERQLEKSDRSCALLVTQSSRAANYGIGTYVTQLSQCLVIAGWDVCIIELDCTRKNAGFSIVDGVGYYKLSQDGVNNRSLEYSYAQFFIQHFYMKRKRVICHFNFAIYPLMVERLRSVLQVKIIFTLHFTSWSFELMGDKKHLIRILKDQKNEQERHVYKTFTDEKDFMLMYCDRVIAIAQHSYDMLRDIYGVPENKLILIPNGHTLVKASRNIRHRLALRQKFGFNESDKILIFCGRLDPIKGIIYLMDAFRVLSNKLKDVKLVVIGDGNLIACLKYADGLWNKVAFTGFLEKSKIMELYEMADIGVVPSIHEEFGFVALEMMMAGLPIIANNTTGLANLTENGKYGLLYNHERALEEDGFLSVAEKVLSGKLSIPVADTKVLEERYSIDAFRRKMLKLYSTI